MGKVLSGLEIQRKTKEELPSVSMPPPWPPGRLWPGSPPPRGAPSLFVSSVAPVLDLVLHHGHPEGPRYASLFILIKQRRVCVSFKTGEDSGDRSHFSGCPEWHRLTLSCLEVFLMFCLLPPGGWGCWQEVVLSVDGIAASLRTRRGVWAPLGGRVAD